MADFSFGKNPDWKRIWIEKELSMRTDISVKPIFEKASRKCKGVQEQNLKRKEREVLFSYKGFQRIFLYKSGGYALLSDRERSGTVGDFCCRKNGISFGKISGKSTDEGV